jgi:hypothetical protein
MVSWHPILWRMWACVAGLCLSLSVAAQKEDYVPERSKEKEKEWNWKERLVLGGNIGAAFGTITFVQINPQVGLRFTDDLTAGVSANYMYFSQRGFKGQSIMGGGVWARQFVYDFLFVSSEFEVLSLQTYNARGLAQRTTVPVWFVGGGIFQGVRGGFGFTLMAMWDVIDDPNSPYINPIIRVGGGFGF